MPRSLALVTFGEHLFTQSLADLLSTDVILQVLFHLI